MTRLITFAGNVLVFLGDWLLSLAYGRDEERTKRVVDQALSEQRVTGPGLGRYLATADIERRNLCDPVIGTWTDVVKARVPCPCEECARDREMRRRAAN